MIHPIFADLVRRTIPKLVREFINDFRLVHDVEGLIIHKHAHVFAFIVISIH